MKPCIVRKAPYRLPGTNRLIWCVVLAESQGLSLLFVRSPDKNGSHQLTIGKETAEQVFESVNVSSFPIKRPQLLAATAILAMLGGAMTEEDISKILEQSGYTKGHENETDTE
jgi:hypothetical protein